VKKPNEIKYAEWALWAWTAWTCVFGTYQTWREVPEMQAAIAGQLQGVISISMSSVLEWTIVGYAFLALTAAWFIFKVGQGKKWARSSFMWSFAAEALWAALPPYHGIAEHLPDIPDLGLQAYALYLLYAWPGRTWFNQEERVFEARARTDGTP